MVFEPIQTQEALEKIIQERLVKYQDYDALKQKAEAYDDMAKQLNTMDRDYTALKATIEVNNQELESYKQKVSTYESEKLKMGIALKHGLPIDLANRLQGSDESELTADAERFAAYLKPSVPTPPIRDSEPRPNGDDMYYKKLVESLSIEE